PLDQLRANQPVTDVKPGDVVLILPDFFTGNTDFKDTPLGPMEGGFLQAALLSSLLSGHSIREVGGRAPATVAAIALGVTLATVLSPLAYWLTVFAVAL